MGALEKDARAFCGTKERQVAEARQCAAFFLASGIDLAAALETSGEERQVILSRLGRLIERERLRGVRRHVSYDLNRHIALKQAFDRLKATSHGLTRNSPGREENDAFENRDAVRAAARRHRKRRSRHLPPVQAIS